MIKRKCDRSIGYRAAEEMLKVNASIREQCRQLGIDRNSFYQWQQGTACPDARALQALALAGYDVHYILLGSKRKE